MNKYKKKISDYIHTDDYWMAFAFLIASKSEGLNQGCAIVSQNNDLISLSSDGKLIYDTNFHLYAEIKAVQNDKNISGATVYLTYTPTYDSLVWLLSYKVKRIVYYPTDDLDLGNLKDSSYTTIESFRGNLNWIRDYFDIIDK